MARHTESQDRKPTHEDIARVIGKDRSIVTRYFSGRRQPSIADAVVIFEMTGEKLGPLAGKTDDEIARIAEVDRLIRGAA